jgi:hypothetical protein
MRAGRNLAQTAKEYDASMFVPVELWMRDMERRLLGMERRLATLARPVAALGFLLMGVAVADVWEAATGDAVIERAFRKNGRSRKRGLEDGAGLIELRQTAGVAA